MATEVMRVRTHGSGWPWKTWKTTLSVTFGSLESGDLRAGTQAFGRSGWQLSAPKPGWWEAAVRTVHRHRPALRECITCSPRSGELEAHAPTWWSLPRGIPQHRSPVRVRNALWLGTLPSARCRPSSQGTLSRMLPRLVVATRRSSLGQPGGPRRRRRPQKRRLRSPQPPGSVPAPDFRQ